MTVALPLPAPASIASFLDLREQVANRLMRPEADIAGAFPMWLSLTEAEINNSLASALVRAAQIIGSLTVDGEDIYQPGGLIDIEHIYLDGREVKPATPQYVAVRKSQLDEAGPPEYYALVGDKIRFYPAPDTSYTATTVYWSRVSPLSTDNTSNWVFANHSNVYWHGVLAHGYQHYLDEALSDKHAAYFDAALGGMMVAYPERDRGTPVTDINPTSLHQWGLLS